MSIDYNSEPIVSMTDIRKEFPGVKALSGITFNLYKGEIHCLVGENGAGKSTLMKILSGAYRPDGGEIFISGTSYKELTPHLSQKHGIGVIYQENHLIPTMTVAENVFVGIEKTGRFGFFDFKATIEAVKKEMKSLGIDIDPLCMVEKLSVSEQQFVKILKALVLNPQILIMDEPTSMFNVKDVDKVLDLTKRITAKGISIIYISHFLKEIVQIADRITVIRDGSVVNTYGNNDRNIDLDIVTMDMVGRPVDMFYKKDVSEIGDIILRVEELKLTKDAIPVSFELRSGEILGFAGMVGSGRTEIVRAITGADQYYSGRIIYKDKELSPGTPKDSIKAGIAHITEDRQKLGLMLFNSILENITLVGLSEKIKGFFVNVKKHPPLIAGVIDSLNIKTPSVFQEAGYLSGGNQQKVVLGKWLFAGADTYVFDEPTRGIDVNAKAEFYKIMSDLTKEGKSIIMISSDMPELISMSDRILVVQNGRINKEIKKEYITEENIIRSALGMENGNN
ncbi:MAG: sugar ABC transporter ATP-binding protein [Spirochaetales bacterium]|nr:sugar ABC transporter ATP-binding protein [Spirochaetales bacterium]